MSGGGRGVATRRGAGGAATKHLLISGLPRLPIPATTHVSHRVCVADESAH